MKQVSQKVKNLSALAVTSALLLLHANANAQNTPGAGFTQTAGNLNSFFLVVQQTIVVGGVTGGLGVMGWAASQLLKKSGDRGEDITWMSIGLKFLGGALLMALAWVGTQAKQTLGAT